MGSNVGKRADNPPTYDSINGKLDCAEVAWPRAHGRAGSFLSDTGVWVVAVDLSADEYLRRPACGGARQKAARLAGAGGSFVIVTRDLEHVCWVQSDVPKYKTCHERLMAATACVEVAAELKGVAEQPPAQDVYGGEYFRQVARALARSTPEARAAVKVHTPTSALR